MIIYKTVTNVHRNVFKTQQHVHHTEDVISFLRAEGIKGTNIYLSMLEQCDVTPQLSVFQGFFFFTGTTEEDTTAIIVCHPRIISIKIATLLYNSAKSTQVIDKMGSSHELFQYIKCFTVVYCQQYHWFTIPR